MFRQITERSIHVFINPIFIQTLRKDLYATLPRTYGFSLCMVTTYLNACIFSYMCSGTWNALHYTTISKHAVIFGTRSLDRFRASFLITRHDFVYPSETKSAFSKIPDMSAYLSTRKVRQAKHLVDWIWRMRRKISIKFWLLNIFIWIKNP